MDPVKAAIDRYDEVRGSLFNQVFRQGDISQAKKDKDNAKQIAQEVWITTTEDAGEVREDFEYTGDRRFTKVSVSAYPGYESIAPGTILEGFSGPIVYISKPEYMRSGKSWLRYDQKGFVFNPSRQYQHLGHGEQFYVSSRYTVYDRRNYSTSDPKIIGIQVVGRNDTPIAKDSKHKIHQTESISRGFSAEDVDGSDKLTFRVTHKSNSKGQFAINKSGNGYTFNPGNDFLYLGQNESEELFFRYRATDDSGQSNGTSNEATISFTINGRNDAPKITSSPSSPLPNLKLEDTEESDTKPIGGNLSELLSKNVSDPDQGASLTY